jgi:hypothetical protein
MFRRVDNLGVRGSPIPDLAPLPLYRDAGEIAHLDPDEARAGSVGAVDLLRENALGTKPASMGEHSQPIFGKARCPPRYRIAAAPAQPWVGERAIAHVLAVMLDQVEGIEDSRHRRPKRIASVENVVAVCDSRRFAGLPVQGDALYSLYRCVDLICREIGRGPPAFEEANDLRNTLQEYLSDYEAVLREHGIALPFSE